MPTALYVDDEQTLRRTVARWLGARGVEIHAARNIFSAKRCFARYLIDGAFIDVWLPDGTGFELYAWIQEHHPVVARNVVFVTGDIILKETARAKFSALGRPVLAKPFDLADLVRQVEAWSARGGGTTHAQRGTRR